MKTYVIVNSVDDQVYWSNELGWTNSGHATKFTHEDRLRVALPIMGMWEEREEPIPDAAWPTEANEAQRTTLYHKWQQDGQDLTWAEFVKGVHPTFGCNGAVTVQWSGMWLCIETDGYCHT